MQNLAGTWEEDAGRLSAMRPPVNTHPLPCSWRVHRNTTRNHVLDKNGATRHAPSHHQPRGSRATYHPPACLRQKLRSTCYDPGCSRWQERLLTRQSSATPAHISRDMHRNTIAAAVVVVIVVVIVAVSASSSRSNSVPNIDSGTCTVDISC